MTGFPPLPSLQDYRVKEWVALAGDQTLRLEYDLGPDSIVLDLGAYRGDFAQQIIDRYGSRLYLSEPVPIYVDALRERFAGIEKVVILPFAVGAEDGTLNFSIEGDATSSFRSGQASIVAPVKRITQVFAELGLDRVDLLKINIEGAEYEILEALADSGRISDVLNIQVQFHDFVENAQEKLSRLRDRLAETHYPTYMHTFVWENWRRREGMQHEGTIHSLVASTSAVRDRCVSQSLQIERQGRELAVLREKLARLTFSWWWARSLRFVRRLLSFSSAQ